MLCHSNSTVLQYNFSRVEHDTFGVCGRRQEWIFKRELRISRRKDLSIVLLSRSHFYYYLELFGNKKGREVARPAIARHLSFVMKSFFLPYFSSLGVDLLLTFILLKST